MMKKQRDGCNCGLKSILEKQAEKCIMFNRAVNRNRQRTDKQHYQDKIRSDQCKNCLV